MLTLRFFSFHALLLLLLLSFKCVLASENNADTISVISEELTEISIELSPKSLKNQPNFLPSSVVQYNKQHNISFRVTSNTNIDIVEAIAGKKVKSLSLKPFIENNEKQQL